jgi:hypothetical protein
MQSPDNLLSGDCIFISQYLVPAPLHHMAHGKKSTIAEQPYQIIGL